MAQVDVITPEMLVEDIVARFPATARVFIKRRMNCVGCDVARFETLREACEIYGVAVDDVLAEVLEIVNAPSDSRPAGQRR